MASLEDPNNFYMFGSLDASCLWNRKWRTISHWATIILNLLEIVVVLRKMLTTPMIPDSFFEDFPTVMFNHIEPPPSHMCCWRLNFELVSLAGNWQGPQGMVFLLTAIISTTTFCHYLSCFGCLMEIFFFIYRLNWIWVLCQS